MSSTSITQRPTSFIAAACAVAAIGAGALVLSVSHDAGRPSAPAGQSQTSVRHSTPQSHHFHVTPAGGRVMIGQ